MGLLVAFANKSAIDTENSKSYPRTKGTCSSSSLHRADTYVEKGDDVEHITSILISTLRNFGQGHDVGNGEARDED